jgi:hypothetical protein
MLDLGSSWMRVVNFMPFYPRFPLDSRMCGSHKRSRQCREENNFATYQDSNSDPSAVKPVACCYTDCAISDLVLEKLLKVTSFCKTRFGYSDGLLAIATELK